jgi:hypothetical protein
MTQDVFDFRLYLRLAFKAVGVYTSLRGRLYLIMQLLSI